jgi:hypothetical protein
MIDPQTPEEWQEAVDTAHVMLLIESARQFGIVRGGPKVVVARCEEILERGKARGYTPAEDVVERLVGEGVTL